MGLFGSDEQDIDEAQLVKAMRRRLLDEIQTRKDRDAEKIVNNIYGSSMAGGGGIMDRLGGSDPGSSDPRADRDYFVDILRQNYEPGEEVDVMDPDSGQRIKKKLNSGGWQKLVHRYEKKKVVP